MSQLWNSLSAELSLPVLAPPRAVPSRLWSPSLSELPSLEAPPKRLQTLEVYQGPWVSLLCGQELPGKKIGHQALDPRAPEGAVAGGGEVVQERLKGREKCPAQESSQRQLRFPLKDSSLCLGMLVIPMALDWGMASGS